MIRRETIGGREASVAYMDGDMNPVDDPEDADLIKIIFDDGETVWATPADEGDEESDDDLLEESGISDPRKAEDQYSPEEMAGGKPGGGGPGGIMPAPGSAVPPRKNEGVHEE